MRQNFYLWKIKLNIVCIKPMKRLFLLLFFLLSCLLYFAQPVPPILFSDRRSSAVASLQAVVEGLEERRATLGHMEADCEALSRFVTPGEAGHIRARLMQMRRYWEELKGRAEQLGGRLNQSASYRQRYNDNLELVYSNTSWNSLVQKL